MEIRILYIFIVCFFLFLLAKLYLENLFGTLQSNVSLARCIENLNCLAFTPIDPDLLVLKAISTTSTQCLHQCLSILQRHQEMCSIRMEAGNQSNNIV